MSSQPIMRWSEDPCDKWCRSTISTKQARQMRCAYIFESVSLILLIPQKPFSEAGHVQRSLEGRHWSCDEVKDIWAIREIDYVVDVGTDAYVSQLGT